MHSQDCWLQRSAAGSPPRLTHVRDCNCALRPPPAHVASPPPLGTPLHSPLLGLPPSGAHAGFTGDLLSCRQRGCRLRALRCHDVGIVVSCGPPATGHRPVVWICLVLPRSYTRLSTSGHGAAAGLSVSLLGGDLPSLHAFTHLHVWSLRGPSASAMPSIYDRYSL